jgi:hypothetical protein
MKTVYIILLVIVLLITSGYLFIRFSLLRSKDFKPDNSKSRSFLDLRPSIIAKIQQLVKDGSGGLYFLSIEKIEPNVLSSRVDIINASITPDSTVLNKLDKANKLSDNLFKISFSSLHIEGIGIGDLLSKEHLKLKNILVKAPVIEVYHEKRAYNYPVKLNNDNTSLYDLIMKKIKSVAVDKIEVTGGTIINHDRTAKTNSRFNDVSIKMHNVLIDSSTEFDKTRFLYAKQVEISTSNFGGKTPDDLYFFKCGTIHISTVRNTFSVLQFELHPVGGKKQFENKLSARKEMYDIKIPQIKLSNINWWRLQNEKSIDAKQGIINKGTCKVFLDRSLPFRNVKQNNFPQQLLMRIPIPISILKMRLINSNLYYSEYNPGMSKTGTIYINNINGSISNITNMQEKIKRNAWLVIKGSGIFMHKVPLTNGFQFNLAKFKTGDFTMDLDIRAMDSSVLNPISVPMGEFMIKKGTIERGIAHVRGTNFQATGNGLLLYKDLYLVGLKQKNNEPGKIKKKSVLSFLGNLLLIKNANPSRGDPPRYKQFNSIRGPHTTFMSLVWKTIYIGILKTIGLPERFADKAY